MLSDRIGRSQAMILSIGSYGLFSLLTGFTNSWMLVMICRFFSGFGVGGVLVITPTILSEVLPEKSRSIFIGILSIGFPIGIFSAGLIDFFVANWHQGFLVGLVPLVLAILCIRVLGESTQWQSSKQNNLSFDRTGLLRDPEYRKNLILGSISFGMMLIGLWAIFLWLPSWIQTLLTTSEGQKERGISMMALGGAGLAGGFISGWLANAMGNKKAMVLCFAGCFVMSALLFKFNRAFSSAIYIEIALLALFFGASQGVLSGFIPSLFPPSIRATATGFCFNIGRFVTAITVFFVGAFVSGLGGYGNALLTFSLVFLAGLITTIFQKEIHSRGRETKYEAVEPPITRGVSSGQL
ncbi:MAG TPA: MFS transporter [Cyclobacteriaceae bacterium]|nr:MFS transporter [Cyclobacteriaceae bacterium]